jgi:hypothetical protein
LEPNLKPNGTSGSKLYLQINQTILSLDPENIQDSEPPSEDYNNIYDKLIETTTKALELLQEQKTASNFHWIKGVEKNFAPITKMIEEVERYQRKRTMPYIWKGHTNNTRFLN